MIALDSRSRFGSGFRVRVRPLRPGARGRRPRGSDGRSSTATAPHRWARSGLGLGRREGGPGVRGRTPGGAAGSGFRRSNERAPAARPGHDLRSKLQGFAPVAIHPSYRTSLRSSSNDEPRYPSLKVVSLPGGRLGLSIRRRIRRARWGPGPRGRRDVVPVRGLPRFAGVLRGDRPPARRTGDGAARIEGR